MRGLRVVDQHLLQWLQGVNAQHQLRAAGAARAGRQDAAAQHLGLHGCQRLHAPLILRLYFGWLPAALLIALIAAVGATAGPTALRRPARIAAPLIGAASAIATCWALQNLWSRVGSRSGLSIAADSRVGMWAVLLGFALLGVAGALGLRRR